MKNPSLRRLTVLLAPWIAMVPFGHAQQLTASANPPDESDAAGPRVTLSPFEVKADDDGYYARNTMSATRLNGKIEDVGASISVVTKQEMEDFAMVDINDIFSYEGGTEGKGNYTNFSFDGNGSPVDNTQLDPVTANRIRGIGNANVTFGTFETSGRMPLDPTIMDATEISRGPNSSLFGIGNVSGTVNTVPSAANLFRNRVQVQSRFDSFDGYRQSLDVNQVLKEGVLAVRGSAVFQRDGYHLKPSGTNTERYNGMFKFQPFKFTTLSGFYDYYHVYGNRPNDTTPQQAITGWQKAGSPTWDPTTSTVHINGAAVGSFATTTPPYFTTGELQEYSNVSVDRQGITYWTTGRTTDTALPYSYDQSDRLMEAVNDTTGTLAVQPLFTKYLPATSKAMYDWSSTNLAAPNYLDETDQVANVNLEQIFVSTPEQQLGLQLGWLREADTRYLHNTIGVAPSFGLPNVLAVDVNEKLLNGQPNPNFLRPYYIVASPVSTSTPLSRNTYRAQLAYILDLSHEKSWLRWLGMHQLVGYAEYKDFVSRQIWLKDAIVDNHSWLPAGTTRANTSAYGGAPYKTTISMENFLFYLGAPGANSVQYAPGNYHWGNYVLNWGNGVTGQFNQEPAQLGQAVSTNTGGSGNSWSILKAQGLVLQDHFLNDHLVTTFGYRFDKSYSRVGGAIVSPDGISLDHGSWESWAPGDWTVGKGPTRTVGAVGKIFDWLDVFADKSASFQPTTPAENVYFQQLPNPYGKGQDWGLMLKLFDGKLVVRADQYTTTQFKSRDSTSGGFAQRLLLVDRGSVPGQTGTPPAFQLQTLETTWITAAAAKQGITLTPDQLTQQVAQAMGVDPSFFNPIPYTIRSTDDDTAKGKEFEIDYNPAPYWTFKANVTQAFSLNSNLSPELTTYLNSRMAVWTTIVDPTTGQPWFTTNYNGNQSAAQYVAANITAPIQLAHALEGKNRPEMREYRFNGMSSYNLAGLTENRFWRRFTLGGALRWESKGAIGYYGLPPDANGIIDGYDANRPVWDKAHIDLDTFVRYGTRMYRGRIAASFQLNVKNVNESGRLEPISANPDGTPNAYRIIDPREFSFTATFSL